MQKRELTAVYSFLFHFFFLKNSNKSDIRKTKKKQADAFALFEPEWTCPKEMRLGKLGDGGKWICPVGSLTENDSKPVVYSIGSAGEDSFEMDFIFRWRQAEVYVIDPDPSYERPGLPYHYYPYAVDTHDGDGKVTIQKFAEGQKHAKIDVLKMDIERSEWSVIPKLLSKSGKENPEVSQMVIEFHFDRPSDIDPLIVIMQMFMDAGYVLFHKENSLFNIHGAEMSFIRLSEVRDYVH